MRILIAGAAGFIGCHLADRYLRLGHTVIGVDNLCTGSESNVQWLKRHRQFEFMRHDVTSPLDVKGPVELVCDLACPAGPVDFRTLSAEIMQVCSQGVKNLLDLALRKRCEFLYASTNELYDEPEACPQAESYWGNVNPIGQCSVYDDGKRLAETFVMTYRRSYGLPVRVARISDTYGPRMRADDGRIVSTFINCALTGEPLPVQGDGTQTRSFCYVDDQVEGLVRLAASDYDRPIDIGNPLEVAIIDLAREVIQLAGSDSGITNVPLPPDDPSRWRPDITLARQVLGWQPQVDLHQGLSATIRFFAQPHYAQAVTGVDVVAQA